MFINTRTKAVIKEERDRKERLAKRSSKKKKKFKNLPWEDKRVILQRERLIQQEFDRLAAIAAKYSNV